MSPIQQMLLGVGAVAKKTYVDDVFSTYLYKGNATNRSIVNGIDLAGEGGLVWIKNRDAAWRNRLNDTVRGAGEEIKSDADHAESTASTSLTQFNSNGFNLGIHNDVNKDGDDHSSWTFRKAKGFFDVVTYTGTGGATQSVAHNLASVPGCIMVKRLTGGTESWAVYHKNMSDGTTAAPGEKICELNTSDARKSSTSYFTATLPTATHFYVGSNNGTGASGEDYVAYVFAGGEEGYGSSEFDGTSDYLTIPASTSQLTWGSSDSLTLEAYVRITNLSAKSNHTIMSRWVSNAMCFLVHVKSDGGVFFAKGPGSGNSHSGVSETSGGYITNNTWHHVAITKNGTSGTVWIDGVSRSTFTWDDACSPSAAGNVYIGEKLDSSGGYTPHGNISNVRITIGQALYTSSFTPSTTPLTTTSQSATASNVKILCCNETDVLSSIKTTGTISKNGDIKGSSLHPFNSAPDAVFGDAGDQNVIKCGSYVGNGNANGPEIFVGWEPSWLLIKRISGTEDWMLFDNIRTSSRTDMHLDDLRPNLSNAEGDGAGGDSNSFLNWTSTGFKLQSNTAHTNDDEDTYIFCAIRRPDGYVGKPPELGTGVFAMDYGAGSSTIPNFDSGFPVDFAFIKKWQDPSDWETSARLIQGKYLELNDTASESSGAGYTFDSNAGFDKSGKDSNWLGYMFKRHAGFDVVAFTGVSGTQAINHGLSKVPEMFVVKRRDNTGNWYCYHKGLNGGTNPEQWRVAWNSDAAADQSAATWSNTAPTATQFTTGTHSDSGNVAGATYIAMLFASVEGISKVGAFDGSDSAQTIEFGFQPRFLIIKSSTHGYHWNVLDTVRGITSGSNTDDKYLRLSNNSGQGDHTFGAVTSTGFTFDGGQADSNDAGKSYIYYAHA